MEVDSFHFLKDKSSWLVIKNSMKCRCSIADGEVNPVEGELSKSLLENNKCYILDCGAEVFLWVGRLTQVEERKSACQAVEVLTL